MTAHLDVVERHIGLLKDQVDQNNFGNCVSISADYTRFYVISGDVDEIFWGELTQNVFKEMSTLHQSFDVESKLDDIHAKWKQKLDSALAAFKSGKQTDMYASFRDMRVYMTELQFNAWHSSSPKRIPRRDRLFSE